MSWVSFIEILKFRRVISPRCRQSRGTGEVNNYLLSLGSVIQLLVLMHFTGSKGLCVVIYNLGSFREPTSYVELLAIFQRQNSIKMVANDEDWDTIPRTHILVQRGKVLEDALREVRKIDSIQLNSLM